MMEDFIVCGPIIFFRSQEVSGREEINCGRLCFQKQA